MLTWPWKTKKLEIGVDFDVAIFMLKLWRKIKAYEICTLKCGCQCIDFFKSFTTNKK